MKAAPGHVLISRTDSIGDVVLTLPLARIIKDRYPGTRISFLGKAYTRPVIAACAYVDAFIDLEDFMQQPFTGSLPDAILHVFPVRAIAQRAKHLGIRERIGTTGRLYHWTTCNRLVRLSRKNSDLHEAQLNTKLLQPLGIDRHFSLEELGASIGLSNTQPLPDSFRSLVDPLRFNLILHPRSQGSAREWGLENFARLVRMLPKDRFKLFISGTAKERAEMEGLFRIIADQGVTDLCGRMDLETFISFIGACDGLVANSTGPLHIAAALGRRAIGIYPPIRPMHPGRWMPLGPAATYLVQTAPCESCRSQPSACTCMKRIRPEEVRNLLPQ